MTVSEWLRNKILRFLKIDHLTESPNAQRLTYINSDEDIRVAQVMENRVWYVGMDSEILNFYTGEMVFGYYKNPIYNRNSRQFFWGQSTKECEIKRIHTGLARAIINTLVNAIGSPVIKVGCNKGISKDAIEKSKKQSELLQKILEYNDFNTKCNQEQEPLTMVEGDGAWKIIIDEDFCEYPILQYYDSQNVEYIEKYGKIIGITFKDYYKDEKGRDYIKFETRRISENGDSIIEHDLFRLTKSNELVPADLSDIPELANLKPLVIPGLNRIFAVPCRYFYNPVYPKRGLSLFNGKIGLFDMLDEIYSQLSQTNRVSTPVEYFAVDILEHDKNGNPILPAKYNRQFIQKQGVPDGDGVSKGKDIETTQPQLNFSQYLEAARGVMDMIFTGQLSPATLGIDVAKKDNADAQREKEKVTMMTRNNIIDRQTAIDKELCTLLLMAKEYIDERKISIIDYDISVKFNEFANPSFEEELSSLGSARAQGNMSPRMFIELLYGDNLSDEEKEKEIKYIEEHDQQDQFNLGNMMGSMNDESEEPTQPTDTEPGQEE